MSRGAPRRILTVLVASALAWWLVARPLPTDDSLSRLRTSETLRIGYAFEAPYAFVEGGGRVTGESPEMARRIAARLGIQRIEWVQTEFGSLADGLLSGRFDMIASGFFITPERARRVCFSRPSFHVRESLLVRRGNPRGLHSYAEAVQAPDVRIAVLTGAVEESLLLRLGLPRSRTIAVPDARTGFSAVTNGLAEGLAVSSPTVRWMAARDPLQATEEAEPFTPSRMDFTSRLGFGAFAFRPRDAELRLAWDAELKRFLGSAGHRRLVAPFGFGASELPGLVNAEDLVGPP